MNRFFGVRASLVAAMLGLMGYAVCESSAIAASELDQRLDGLTQQITKKMGEKSKKKIAVVEFSDLQGSVNNFGRYLSEELITRLVNSGKFEDVVERRLLTKVISEHKLSLTEIVDPSSAKQLGKILGVDAIVSGTVSDLGNSLKVNARLIGTETGSIFAAASTTITKDESVHKLIGGEKASLSMPKSKQEGLTESKMAVEGSEKNPFSGIQVREVNEKDQRRVRVAPGYSGGVVVLLVEKGSRAYQGGLRSGDWITHVNSVRIDNGEQFKSVIQYLEGSARVIVKRPGSVKTLQIHD